MTVVILTVAIVTVVIAIVVIVTVVIVTVVIVTVVIVKFFSKNNFDILTTKENFKGQRFAIPAMFFFFMCVDSLFFKYNKSCFFTFLKK